MAIDSVTENYEGADFEVTSKSKKAGRLFDVVCADGSDPLSMPSEARQAAGIPQIFDVHPVDNELFCNHKTVINGTGPLHWKVTASYDTAKNSGPPLLRPPEINWSFAVSNNEIDRDIFSNPITNSSGEAFDPPITKDFHDLTLSIVKNQEDYDPVEALAFIGTLNNSSFFVFDAGQVKITRFDGAEITGEGQTYFRVSYEFQIRLDGWKRKILDQGMRDIDGEQFKDSTGTTLSEPSKLNGLGAKLASGLPAVILEFELFAESNYSSLNIT